MSRRAGTQPPADPFAHSPLGLYLHVPFCASTCDFCAFYQTTPDREGVDSYLATTLSELQSVRWRRSPDTVFWGGGTPGLLAPKDLRALGESMLSICSVPPSEWTVELAPGSVTEERLSVLRDLGVTRVSLGVQSFSPSLLEALGRRHSREQVLRAYDRVRAAGFHSVNLDLMFALPGQDVASLQEDLSTALALAPDHLSTYCLTFEEDTKLWLKLSQGRVKLDPALEERLYLETWATLGAAGYSQYEVSNFARPGHVCRHNLNTWLMHEWVGIGPSAAGQHDGVRGANPADLALWTSQIAAGERMTEDRVRLSPALIAEDSLIFGLRLVDGVDVAALRARLPGLDGWSAVEAVLARLVEAGLAARACETIRLTTRGRLVADAAGAELMGLLA